MPCEQSRAMTAVIGQNEKHQFIVGTFTAKEDNEVTHDLETPHASLARLCS